MFRSRSKLNGTVHYQKQVLSVVNKDESFNAEIIYSTRVYGRKISKQNATLQFISNFTSNTQCTRSTLSNDNTNFANCTIYC